MIDIMDVKPHEVSSNITGYAIAIMGPPGVGKTTLASKIPGSLLLATEPGYKAIPGILAVDINSWTDVLQVVSQLRKPAAKEKYQTIVIDTLDEFVFLATQFLLQKEGVNDITDIEWGKGYTLLEDMMRTVFRQIQQNYGLILIAHDGRKVDEEDKKLSYASLNFNRKVKRVIMGLLDILAYVESRRGAEESIMHFRDSDKWEAKSRFKNIVESCPFSYEGLVKAVADAVNGIATTSERQSVSISTDALPTPEVFENYLTQFNETAMSVINTTGKGTEVKEAIEIALNGRKLSQATIQDYFILLTLEEELKNIK